jgi:magnesium transporter
VRIAGTARLLAARRPPPGSLPGAFASLAGAHPSRVHAFCYGPDGLEEHEIDGPEALRRAVSGEGVAWIDVVGLGDGRVLHWIRDVLEVHPLAVADLANTPQRPKFEDYGDRDLIVSQYVRVSDEDGIEIDQVGLVVGPGWVVSVVERPCDVFEPLRERIRSAGPIRRLGADYLAYALLDAVIDACFPVLETLGELLDDLEEEIVNRPERATLGRLHAIRRTLLALHRSMWRQRDALGQMIRSEGSPFGESVRLYLRDAHDHCLQVLDTVDTYREMTVGLMDVYLSSVSNRLNEVMKTLTVMATIFIPLTFLVGVYGMNFRNMPELHWRWGYPALWVVMLLVSGGLLLWFRRRGWLGGGRRSEEEGE